MVQKLSGSEEMDGVKAACFAPPPVAVTRARGEGWCRGPGTWEPPVHTAQPTFTRGEGSAWSKRGFPRRAGHHEAC